MILKTMFVQWKKKKWSMAWVNKKLIKKKNQFT